MRRVKSQVKQIAVVTLECVGCKLRKDVDPRDVKEQPMCDKCYLPMVVIRAEVRN